MLQFYPTVYDQAAEKPPTAYECIVTTLVQTREGTI